MKDASRYHLGSSALLSTFLAATVIATPVWGAAGRNANPTSKFFVTDIQGSAEIDTGEKIEELKKKSVHSAEGAVIQTKKPANEAERAKHYSSMVYSNGTGIHLDADTRLEVKRFVQEPFTPNRTDMDLEPSISQTQTFLVRGSIGLCTSKLVAGSSMVYETAHGAVSIRGKKIVVETNDELTRIVMLEGDSTVRGGSGSTLERGGQTLNAGEQALIRPGPFGQPPTVQIEPIPSHLLKRFEDKVSMACAAKRTVYFDVGDEEAGFGGFAGQNGNGQEIRAFEVVPGKLPIQFTVSPATLR